MGFFIGLLTVIMVFNCLLLILLVLIQLPKKEAGAALAFGGGTTDALFGAGSGTVLTKITKYAAAGFFALAILVSVLVGRYHTAGSSTFEQQFNNPNNPAAPTRPSIPSSTPSTTPGSPSVKSVAPTIPATNSIILPTAESTNVAAPTPSVPTANGATSSNGAPK